MTFSVQYPTDKTFGVRKHFLLYYLNNKSQVSAGVEVVTEQIDSTDRVMKASQLKCVKPDTDDCYMEDCLGPIELQWFYDNVPVESPYWERIAAAMLTAKKDLTCDGNANNTSATDDDNSDNDGTGTDINDRTKSAMKQQSTVLVTLAAAKKRGLSAATPGKKRKSKRMQQSTVVKNRTKRAKKASRTKVVIKVEKDDGSPSKGDTTITMNNSKNNSSRLLGLFKHIGAVHDVPALGNCGCQALQCALELVDMHVTKCPHQHWQSIFQYAVSIQDKLRLTVQLYPQSFRTRAKWNGFFRDRVPMPIFKPTVDFWESAELCRWMDAEYVLPNFAMYYNITHVVYDTTIRGTVSYHGYFWDTSGINIVDSASVWLVLWNSVHFNYIAR